MTNEPGYIKIINEFVEKEPRILAAYLLGSGARDQLRPDSDIDIGIILEPGQKMSPLERINMANSISYALGKTVDMGLINSKNLVYAKEAIFTGRKIFARDESRSLLENARLLGMYIRFNEDRKEVLDAYRA